MKIYAGHLIPAADLAAEMQRQREAYTQMLDTYRQLEQEVFQAPESMPAQYQFSYLTLRYGILSAQVWLSWCDEVEQVIERMEQG